MSLIERNGAGGRFAALAQDSLRFAAGLTTALERLAGEPELASRPEAGARSRTWGSDAAVDRVAALLSG